MWESGEKKNTTEEMTDEEKEKKAFCNCLPYDLQYLPYSPDDVHIMPLDATVAANATNIEEKRKRMIMPEPYVSIV